MLRKAVLGLLLLAGLALVGGCLGQAGEPGVRPTTTNPGPPTPALAPASIPGRLAPDFALPDLAGDELRLSDLRGQGVLVNFWATW